MTIANWGLYFDLLQDKYGAPYFSDAWKSLLFNRAIIDYVNSHFEDNNKNKGLNIEYNQDTLKSLGPLVVSLYPVTMNSLGRVTKTNLTTLLRAATGNNSDNVYRILNILWWDSTTNVNDMLFRPVKHIRENDLGQFVINVFKKPSVKEPRWYEGSLEYNFLPVSTTTSLTFTLLRYPRTVDITTAVDCDLPDFTHNEILARAIQLAGIASRDEALTQLTILQSQQK